MKNRQAHIANYDKYTYLIENPIWVKILYGFGLLSWILLLYGYTRFLNLNIWYWVIFGPVLTILTIYNFLNYGINLFYKKFNLPAHEDLKKSFWKKTKKLPSVDIFLPVCGEKISLLKNTFAAVKKINYQNKKVYVLDDGDNTDVIHLAKEFNFIYLSRPDKRVMKKAGNLKYGFEHSNGDFYVVFDADFAPHPDFVTELLPYMGNKQIGIVQSPQYFEINKHIHKRSQIEYGSANLQEDFYRIIQTARDTFGGSICVGSNAIYRRGAIAKIGGPTQVDHGEDVHTGVDVISNGFKLKYVPLVLAKGLCPDTLQAFYKQHNRWCSSSTGMFLSGKVLKSNLTPAQKICYYCGFLYYICQLFYFILPLQLFILLGVHSEKISLINAFPFFPYVFFGLILLPLSRKSKPKIGTYLATMSCVYTHSLTVILRFLGRPATWVPTNTIEHGIEKGFEFLNNFSMFFLGTYILAVSVLIFTYHLPILNWSFYSVIFWLLWNIALHLLYLVNTYKTIYRKKAMDALTHLSYKKDFNLWRIRTIGTFIVVLFFLTGSSGYALESTNNQVLFTTRNVILAKSNTVEINKSKTIIAQNKKNEVVLGETTDKKSAKTKEYAETAKAGDSITTLARKAILQYEKENNKKLDDVERIYTETYLVKSHYKSHLGVEDVLIFSYNEIDGIAKNSINMPSIARQAWSRYVPLVSYDIS